MSKDVQINVRTSSAMQRVLLEGGEQSASARALWIIGAAAVGLDVTGIQLEVLELTTARLRPEVSAQLLAIAEGKALRVASSPVDYQPTNFQPVIYQPEQEEDDEELLGDEDGAGFDV